MYYNFLIDQWSILETYMIHTPLQFDMFGICDIHTSLYVIIFVLRVGNEFFLPHIYVCTQVFEAKLLNVMCFDMNKYTTIVLL